MSEDVDTWKKKQNPKMVCPVCDELEIRSCMFHVKLEDPIHPDLWFYDEEGRYHSHYGPRTNYWECSNGHMIRKDEPAVECIVCEEQRTGNYNDGFTEVTPRFTLTAVTDPDIIRQLKTEKYFRRTAKEITHDSERVVN